MNRVLQLSFMTGLVQNVNAFRHICHLFFDLSVFTVDRNLSPGFVIFLTEVLKSPRLAVWNVGLIRFEVESEAFSFVS